MPINVVRWGCSRASRSRVARELAAALLVPAVLAACGGDRGGNDTAAAGGDAGAIEVDALSYEVTPERYQRWLAAQRALDAISGLPEPPALDPAGFSEADLNRAVQYLESDPRARAALARAGVGARDYVLTTLALDQALVASTSTGAGPTAAPAASGGSGGGAPSSAAGARTAERPSATAESTPRRRTRTRYRNVPPSNAELVERNREEIARARTGMRFRIVKERVDTTYVDRPVEPLPPAASARVVPAGTTISLRANTRVCTNTHKAGDRVSATVTTPVSGTNGASIPAGAAASLSLVGSAGQSGPMEFTLNSITVGGQTYSVAGTAVASRVERVRSGSASKDAQKVVGGAAIGAVAGQVLGRDTKSTVIGAAVGAAAGAAAASAGARYDSCVPAGAPISVTLRDALTLRV